MLNTVFSHFLSFKNGPTSSRKAAKRDKSEKKAASDKSDAKESVPLPFPTALDVEDDDDDAPPEDVAFSQSKATALGDLIRKKEEAKRAKETRKEERRKRMEKVALEKKNAKKKKRRQPETLPMEILEEASKKEEKRKNRIKRFDENEEEDVTFHLNERGAGARPSASGSGSIRAVTQRESELFASRAVPEEVASFKQRMLYGSGAAFRRETAAQAAARREKAKQAGSNFVARL